MAFDRNAFLQAAVETPSHDDISEMRSLLSDSLADGGHPSRVDEQRNVIATRGGNTNPDPHLVLNTHIDTVPPHISYEQDGGIVRGRGACDAKGPLAVLVDAFVSASMETGRLTLAVTPNEETSQQGGAYLGETLSADGYIVGEPTGLDVCTAARGNFGGRITIHGESGHASDPSAGRNAVSALEPLLAALRTYDDRRGPGEHEVLGAPTLVPTHVEGGGPLNQIPAECTLSFDRRTVPPETIGGFVTDLESYLGQQLPNEFEYEVSPAFPESSSPDAFSTDRDAELVQTLAENSSGEIRPFGAATEASYFADDAPTVVFGPGTLRDEEGPVAHSAREYVRLEEVEVAAEAVQMTIEELLA